MSAFRIVISALLAVSLGTAASGQQRTASSARQPDPIPRATFILTMDAEFRKMDADKNGLLTRQEIDGFLRATSVLAAQQRNAALFQALDKDQNGQLSALEFGGLPMSVAQPSAAQDLAQVDANRDGQATLIEYRAGKLVNFDRMDADKDGVVSPAEMRAAGLIK